MVDFAQCPQCGWKPQQPAKPVTVAALETSAGDFGTLNEAITATSEAHPWVVERHADGRFEVTPEAGPHPNGGVVYQRPRPKAEQLKQRVMGSAASTK